VDAVRVFERPFAHSPLSPLAPRTPSFAICYLLFAISYTLSAMSQPPIERKELLKAVFKNGVFTSADVREITLQPGQRAGRHLHPCAVLGYIAAGSALYQIEGEPEQILTAGSAFYEPAGAIIAEFGNVSDSEPMTFIAFYLLNGEQDLIQMLDPE
jgi:quercetin dioxygenase-like cupin family protein